MALSDEIYMKHHVSELRDLDEDVVKLWKEGQDRWCMRTHGMSSEDYYAELDAHMKEKFEVPEEYIECSFDPNDGVGGYGSSGRKPLPKDLSEEADWRNDPTLCYECGMPKDGQHKMGCSKLHINGEVNESI